MTRDERVRLVLVGCLALLVMGGVVGFAWHARAQHADDDLTAPGVLAPVVPTVRPPVDRDVVEAGCEVDAERPPAVAFDLPGDALDFGELKQNVVVEREVTVRNTGRGVLCVRDVETGCGCVKAEWLGANRVAPGAAGRVKIKVDTNGREGVQEKSVRLFTNDPKRRVAEFKVRSEIRLGIVVGATMGSGGPILYFGQHAPGTSATASVRLRSPLDEPEWKVTSVESLQPDAATRTTFRWSLRAVEPNDSRSRCYDLEVVHPGRPDVGAFYESIRIRTTHPERGVIDLQTQLYVQQKFYTGPVRATFGFVRRDGKVPAKTVYVMAAEAGTDFVVKGATLEGEGFVADPPRRVKEGWAVDVRYDGRPRDLGRVTATLVVSVDDAEVPELRVPLEATVTGG